MIGRDPAADAALPVSRMSAEHYSWGGACDGWYLLKTGDLSVIEERMPSGAEEVRHFHERARQFFYVLSGELTMELEGRELALRAGDGLEIAPRLSHQAMNRGRQEVRFLVISQPRSLGDRMLAG